MRIIGRLLVLVFGGILVSAAVAAMAAQRVKRDLVKVDDPEANDVRLAAVFEPVAFRSRATNFRGGTVDCWFGGGMIDLREATLDPAGAHLQVKAIFGGGQILVPATWRVTTRVMGLGGIGDSRPATDLPEDAPHLTIEGTAAFGGFGIASEMPESAERGIEQAIEAVAAKRERAHEAVEEAVSAV